MYIYRVKFTQIGEEIMDFETRKLDINFSSPVTITASDNCGVKF